MHECMHVFAPAIQMVELNREYLVFSLCLQNNNVALNIFYLPERMLASEMFAHRSKKQKLLSISILFFVVFIDFHHEKKKYIRHKFDIM